MLGRRVPGLCAGHPAPRPLFEPLDRRDEQTVFDIVVRRKVAFAGEDVKKHAVQLVGTARRVITDDDPLQFGEFRLDLVVVPAEYVDRIAFGMLPPEQPFDIGENFLFLIVHVLVHFGDVLVEEPQDGESHVVMAAIDRLDQLAADGRQAEIEAVDCAQSDVAFAIMRFFDEYAAEVQRHMSYEEQTVFPYVESLLAGEKSSAYSMDIFRRQHDQVDIKLRELKNIIIKYYPSGSTNELNGVLFDIFNCEHELASHNAVEDELFIPAVERLAATGPRTVKPEPLSVREKEIIVCVVKGMTNKQIADALCISAHTVITHRRNIAAKLQIHSAAGLTIYAIVNKLVELSEIKDTIIDPQP